jgi:glutamate-ammonia-ligase adenylyltransferase
LARLVDLDLVTEADAVALREAFLFASRIRNGIVLLRNKPSNVIPANAFDLAGLAEILGYGRNKGSHVSEDWYRLARRAKAVTDRLFWGM